MSIQLPDDLSALFKHPLNDSSIFVGSEQIFFVKDSAYNLLSDWAFLNLFLLLLPFNLVLLLFLFVLSLDFFVEEQFEGNFSFGEIPSPHGSIPGDAVEHMALVTEGGV